jgi:hypothetical protein
MFSDLKEILDDKTVNHILVFGAVMAYSVSKTKQVP